MINKLIPKKPKTDSGAALEAFHHREELRKYLREVKRRLQNSERSLRSWESEQARADNYRRNEGKLNMNVWGGRYSSSEIGIDFKKIASGLGSSRELVEALKGEERKLLSEIDKCDKTLVEVDATALQAEIEVLGKEGKRQSRSLRRGDFDDAEERKALQDILASTEKQIKELAKCLAAVESLQRAKTRKENIARKFLEIKQAVKVYDESLREAIQNYEKLRDLTVGLNLNAQNMNLFLLIASQSAGQKLLDELRSEVEA